MLKSTSNYKTPSMTNQPQITDPQIIAIVLAAGKGTRMRSQLPKVMHRVAGRTMVEHVIACADQTGATDIVTVVGPEMEQVEALATHTHVVIQKERKGTGHAVLCAKDVVEQTINPKEDAITLILYGDTPLITKETLQLLTTKAQQADVTVAGIHLNDPTGYGRLVTENSQLKYIVECKDANAEEKRIQLCNSGVMAIKTKHLFALLSNVKNSNANGEYYLTDIASLAVAENLSTQVVEMPAEEFQGVNTRAQLAMVEHTLQQRLRQNAMLTGATLLDPETVYFNWDTQIGTDVIIHPHVFFGEKVVIADNVTIRSYSHIEGATVAKNCIIGPFARLRPGAVLSEDVHIGNFVEIKKSQLALGAKVNHLTYIGDATIGEYANIGAGTITCNYDGVHKHQTTIGEHAFIGSNTSLVAPVTVGKGAIVGAGSVITDDIPEDALAVERNKQITKPEGAAKLKAKIKTVNSQ